MWGINYSYSNIPAASVTGRLVQDCVDDVDDNKDDDEDDEDDEYDEDDDMSNDDVAKTLHNMYMYREISVLNILTVKYNEL